VREETQKERSIHLLLSPNSPFPSSTSFPLLDKSKKVQDYVKSVVVTVKDGLERKAKANFTPDQLEAEKCVVF